MEKHIPMNHQDNVLGVLVRQVTIQNWQTYIYWLLVIQVFTISIKQGIYNITHSHVHLERIVYSCTPPLRSMEVKLV